MERFEWCFDKIIEEFSAEGALLGTGISPEGGNGNTQVAANFTHGDGNTLSTTTGVHPILEAALTPKAVSYTHLTLPTKRIV